MSKTAFDHLRDGWIETDLAGNVLRVNRAFEDMLGYSESELTHMSFWDLTPPEFHEREREIIAEQIMKEGRSGIYEKEYVTRDGRRISVELSVYLLRDENGDSCGMWGLIRDVSEQRSTTAMNERLIAAVGQVGEAIVMTDLDANIIYVNPAFERITGYMRSEVIGCNPRILQSGRTPSELYDQMWDTLKAGGVWQGRFINVRKSGEEYLEDATVSPVRDATGRVVNYVGVKRDISREQELEEQLRQSQKMEAVGKLAGGVAHDFNNLLMVIMSAADFAMDECDEEGEIHRELESILAAANKASTLTRQLLAFSRRQNFVPRMIDLNEIVLELQKMLGRLIGEDIRLHVEPSGDSCRIKADPGQIEQVIVNLVVNARDAMPNGGSLVIQVSHMIMTDDLKSRFPTAVETEHDRFAVLSVEDTGIGMDEATSRRVFEPFFTTKTKERGTGLGLSTVYGIVRQHEGQVLIESQPEIGTVFRVFLPELSEPCDEEAEQVEKKSLPGGDETILVAEDNESVRKVAVRMMQQLGYNVFAVGSGEEAIEVFEEQKNEIDLLLTDVVMPGIDGPELAEILRTDKPMLPVVYASGYPESHAQRLANLSDADSLLRKPFSIVELSSVIREKLDAGTTDNV